MHVFHIKIAIWNTTNVAGGPDVAQAFPITSPGGVFRQFLNVSVNVIDVKNGQLEVARIFQTPAVYLG
jgi:hypothetical protein